jgi:hypothetical protein
MAGVHSPAWWAAVHPEDAEEDGLPGLREGELVLLFTNFFTIALACERFFDALLFTWFQIKRVTLDFLDNVFSLHLALEAPQGILKGFAFLYSNLCQKKYTSKRSQIG